MDENFDDININYLDFDIYSKTIGFFYQDKERIGSIFGFVLTIIYVFISLFLFIFLTISTINKSDIKVHDSILYQKETPEMNINSDSFNFAFGIENYLTGYTRFIDETIYYPEVIYIRKIKEGSIFKTIEERPLTIERCESAKFGKEYQNLLVEGELNNSYCVNNLNLTLTGNFKFDKLSYIKINIYPCVNTTNNKFHCKPKEEINSYLSGTFFSILAKDIGLEPSNFSYPIVPQFQDIYVTIDKSYFRDFAIFYGITEIQTDIGLFYQKFKKERYMNYIKTTQGIYYQDEEKFYNGKSMCEIQIRMSDDIRVQKRTYRKMSDVFAIAGGYMQLISTIFSIITFLTNKIDIEVKLVNSIFNFYPRKRKISLKHKLEKSSIDPPVQDIYNSKDFTFQKLKDTNLSYKKNNSIINSLIDKNKRNSIVEKKRNSIINRNKRNSLVAINKNHLIQFYNNENISQSNDKRKKDNLINGKSSESINNFKRDKDSSNNESNINKSKIAFLTFGMNSNNINKKKNLFKTSLIIKKKVSQKFDNIQRFENIKKNITFNSFYYYCISKFRKNKEHHKIIKLFNLATTFFKQKMDIIYVFHVILLLEKILGKKKDIFSDEDMNFQLNEN